MLNEIPDYSEQLYRCCASTADPGDTYANKPYNELRNTLNQFVRPNLLDNWYFVGGGSQQGGGQFPINQRGQIVYNNLGYDIDRWISFSTELSETVGTDGITLAWTANYALWRQLIGMPVAHSLKGKTVTLSILCKELSGSAYLTETGFAATHFDCPISVGLTKITFTVSDNPTSSDINIWGSANSSAKIQAIKLELGDT